jgi:predicted RNA-binding protein with PUA-like domain
MNYWLLKSEPDCFSFADLCAAPDRTTGWDGVRNFQARNFLRDQMKLGDGILYYHSNADPPAIAGLAEVVEEAHPDPTAFDPSADHYDPKSRLDAPTWYQVKIRAIRAIEPVLALPKLREIAELANMELLRKGSRLSVQPVRPEEWAAVLALANINFSKAVQDSGRPPQDTGGGNGTRRGRKASG